MFWLSFVNGLKMLLHWQVWIALLIYVALNIAFMIIAYLISSKNELTGCIIYPLGLSAIHSVAAGFLILYLYPLMLGLEFAMPMAGMKEMFKFILITSLIAAGATSILSSIPFVGKLVDLPGVENFIKGLIIFRMSSVYFIDDYLTEGEVALIYPTFRQTLGYCLIALAVAGINFLLMTFCSYLSSKRSFLKDTEGVVVMFVTSGISIFCSMIPLFMYAQYVKLSIDIILSVY